MSTPRTDPSPPAPLLPGAGVVRDIRRLVAWALGASIVYGLFMSGSRGGCAGGLDGDGFLGADGLPTDLEPVCWSLQMTPSPFVFAGLAATVLLALTRVLRRADDEAAASRILGRAAMVAVAVALGSFVIGQTWFWLLPADEWAGSGTLFLPFPFASVEVLIEPISSR